MEQPLKNKTFEAFRSADQIVIRRYKRLNSGHVFVDARIDGWQKMQA